MTNKTDVVKVDDCLYFRFSSSTYLVRKSIGNKVIDRSTGVKGTVEQKEDGSWSGKVGIGKAKIKRDKILQQLLSTGTAESKTRRATFESYFDRYIENQKSKAQKTFSASEGPIRLRLKPWFKSNCPFIQSFNPDVWARYCIHQRANPPKNKKGETLQPIKLFHDRKALCAVLKMAHEEGVIPKMYSREKLFLNEGTEKIGKSLDKEDRRKLVSELAHAPEYLKLQVMMALYMGMRIGEIIKLKRDAVNLKKKEIKLEPTAVKTRKTRIVQIHDGVFDLLSKFVKECDKQKGKYIFPHGLGSKVITECDYSRPMVSNKNSWGTLREHAGVDCRFHDLKHTYISMAALLGISTLDMSKQVGTSLKVIEEIYHHTLEESKTKIRSIAMDEIPMESEDD